MKKTRVACGAKRVLRLFQKKQRPPSPFLRMHRKLPAGERLPVPDLAEPYQLLCYAPGDEPRWLELLNGSREFGQWGPERLSKEILSTLLINGGIFAAYRRELIGCASACCIAKFQPDAHLMYVAVLPEHRGKGLGQALVAETLRVCQREGFPGMSLITEAHRLAAVRSYFKLGFTPQFAEGDAGRLEWSNVLNKAFLQGPQ
jgi:ribosomal protein S18 acetylase RimI-like enzyme